MDDDERRLAEIGRIVLDAWKRMKALEDAEPARDVFANGYSAAGLLMDLAEFFPRAIATRTYNCVLRDGNEYGHHAVFSKPLAMLPAQALIDAIERGHIRALHQLGPQGQAALDDALRQWRARRLPPQPDPEHDKRNDHDRDDER
jgi:hypothetical protein